MTTHYDGSAPNVSGVLFFSLLMVSICVCLALYIMYSKGPAGVDGYIDRQTSIYSAWPADQCKLLGTSEADGREHYNCAGPPLRVLRVVEDK